jgi:DNA ligase-1
VSDTAFGELAELCCKLENISKRNEKINLISGFLKNLHPSEVYPAVLLIVGSIFPEFDDRTLDVGWRTLHKVSKNGGQTSLFGGEPSVIYVHKVLYSIAEQSGTGSKKNKEQLLEGLFNSLDRKSREILVRVIYGEMRIGVNEGIMLEGIAEASQVPSNVVRRALMVTGDLGKVAEIALKEGEEGLRNLKATYFIPIKPMLANMAEDAEEIIEEHEGLSAFEFKYDGARIQVHRRDGEVRIFSRRLSDVTLSLPDIIDIVEAFVPGKDFILEGEVIAVGETEQPLPFQDLMRRFTRVKNVHEMAQKIPLHLHLFDLLYMGDELLIDKPYEERWQLLEANIHEKYLSRRIVTGSSEEAEVFLREAILGGHEGLIAKRLDSLYTPGSRGKAWFKLKPAESLDVVVKAAEWGSGRRRGWLSNYHLSVKHGDEYLVIGKTFKGLTDEEFKWMTEKLLSIKTSEERHVVNVYPVLVVEVEFNEIQKSPHYRSGYALRFARIKRIRKDKDPEGADILETVEEMYKKQFKYKDKLELS